MGITRTQENKETWHTNFQSSLEEGPCSAPGTKGSKAALEPPACWHWHFPSALSSRAQGRNSPLFALHRAQQCQECHTPRCKDSRTPAWPQQPAGRTGKFLAQTQALSPLGPQEQSTARGHELPVPICAHPWDRGQGQQLPPCCDTAGRADLHQGIYCRDRGEKLDIP